MNTEWIIESAITGKGAAVYGDMPFALDKLRERAGQHRQYCRYTNSQPFERFVLWRGSQRIAEDNPGIGSVWRSRFVADEMGMEFALKS